MKKSLFVGFLAFVVGAVTGGVVVHFAMKGYDPRTVKIAVGTEAVAAAEENEASKLPTDFTVGNRTYDLLPYLRAGETAISGQNMLARVEAMGVDLGQEDMWYILDHQNEIPAEVRLVRIILVFAGLRYPGGYVGGLVWLGDRWVPSWSWLLNDWNDRGLVLRRKS